MKYVLPLKKIDDSSKFKYVELNSELERFVLHYNFKGKEIEDFCTNKIVL
jgi:hypothetical protein